MTHCEQCPLYRLQLEVPRREVREFRDKYRAFCERMRDEGECVGSEDE